MFKVLDEVCKPTKGSKYSAAVDLYAREDIVIGAGETVKVPLGVCVDLENFRNTIFFSEEKGFIDDKEDDQLQSDLENIWKDFLESHYLQLEPRSSLRVKGLIAGTGIIDLDYKNEIMIILHNPIGGIDAYYQDGSIDLGCSNGGTHFKIEKGKKIAQIMLCEHKTYLMGIESDEERTGGFGSTGN